MANQMMYDLHSMCTTQSRFSDRFTEEKCPGSFQVERYPVLALSSCSPRDPDTSADLNLHDQSVARERRSNEQIGSQGLASDDTCTWRSSHRRQVLTTLPSKLNPSRQANAKLHHRLHHPQWRCRGKNLCFRGNSFCLLRLLIT